MAVVIDKNNEKIVVLWMMNSFPEKSIISQWNFVSLHGKLWEREILKGNTFNCKMTWKNLCGVWKLVNLTVVFRNSKRNGKSVLETLMIRRVVILSFSKPVIRVQDEVFHFTKENTIRKLRSSSFHWSCKRRKINGKHCEFTKRTIWWRRRVKKKENDSRWDD